MRAEASLLVQVQANRVLLLLRPFTIRHSPGGFGSGWRRRRRTRAEAKAGGFAAAGGGGGNANLASSSQWRT